MIIWIWPICSIWLVVDLPPWKMMEWKSDWIIIPTTGEHQIKNVPNQVYGFPYDFCPFKKWGGDPFSSLPPPVISEVPVFSATLPTIRPREESATEPLPPAESLAKSASKAIPIWKTSGISHWELIKDNMYQYVLRFGVKDHVWCSVIYSSLKSYLVVQLLQVKPLRGHKPTTLCISSPRIGLVAI